VSDRKREPVAELGDDGYRIVCHTHDVELAAELMRAKLTEDECSRYTMDEFRAGKAHTCTAECRAAVDPGKGRQIYVRKIHCLDSSYGAGEGWAFQYHECQKGRGAFPAVVFR
jgi:hypothetical protein